MNASHNPAVPREWHVFVSTPGIDYIGHIGTVMETTEELARCAALSKFGDEGDRLALRAHNRERRRVIYESDTFEVQPV